WIERGWAVLVAGWFAALTLGRPQARFFPRALGAVAGATAALAAMLPIWPGGWEVLDWHVSERLRAGLGAVLEAIAVMQEGRPVAPALVAGFYQAVETQVQVFP